MQNSLTERVTKKCPELTDAEITYFLGSHSWLKSDESDEVLSDFLKQFFSGLADRYSMIAKKLNENHSKDDKQMNGVY